MAPSIAQLADDTSLTSAPPPPLKKTKVEPSQPLNTTSPSSLQDPISVTDLFSTESATFTGSALKATAIQSRNDFIPLGIGRPSAELYPWKNGDVSSYFTGLEAPAPIPSAPALHPSSDDGAVQPPPSQPKQGEDRSLETIANEAFTYGPTPGVSEVVSFLTSHVQAIHSPPYRGWRTALSTGSTAGIEISLRIFCNRGDAVFVEEKTYPGFCEAANLIGLVPVPIRMDDDGIMADELARVLEGWNEAERAGKRKPRVLYTIPTGQNPTGITQPLARRREVYAVAEKHGLIIIEDDPYIYLQMGKYTPSSSTSDDISNADAVVPPVRSYLSIDTSGRVIRLDSTSKIMAPGLRCGWVTASEQIITKFLCYTENTCGIVSGVTQLLLYNLLVRQWKEDGFREWLSTLAATYKRRRDAVVKTCLAELPMATARGDNSETKGVCSFRIPEQGMFLWVNIDVSGHQDYRALLEREDTTPELLRKWRAGYEAQLVVDSLANGVQVTRGGLFQLGERDAHEVYIRMTFAAAKETELEEGARRFAEVVRRHFP